ncbi:hypothetical protein [Streptomyces sp. NPDC020965]|uniref:hypothetical protein n=1 Tax=Streptomyces sp. NPDC020965 TaxID=3365105 RepID=UPI00378B69A2
MSSGLSRFAVAGLAGLAALVLMFGSYDGDDGKDSDATDEEKASSRSAARSGVLDRDRTRKLLPPRDALKGWTPVGGPTAEDVTSAPGFVCSSRAAPVCGDAVAYGKALYAKANSGRITFTVYAYKSATAATSAYPHMWKDGHAELRPPLTNARLSGETGQQHNARRGKYPFMTAPGAIVQLRVGTTLLLIESGGADARRLSDARLSDLATMFVKRSQQAQKGEKPSAKVAG